MVETEDRKDEREGKGEWQRKKEKSEGGTAQGRLKDAEAQFAGESRLGPFGSIADDKIGGNYNLVASSGRWQKGMYMYMGAPDCRNGEAFTCSFQ